MDNCGLLRELYCGSNNLKYLDLSECKNLEIVDCSKNLLRDIILPMESKVNFFHCEYNYLQDLSKIQELEGNNVYYEFQKVRPGSKISQYDEEVLLKLIQMSSNKDEQITDNKVETISGVGWIYRDGEYYIKSLELNELEIKYNFITPKKVKISNLEELTDIDFMNSQIDKIEINNCTKLEELDLNQCNLKSIQLSGIPKIRKINISNNNLPTSMKNELRKTYDVEGIEYLDEVYTID